ncbi:GMC oxidoreductase [Rhizobium sp. NRK18]|uniref:GMC oxidoreductase n=1 Tax=Rhizobium sp. NRK18 TaxID=2964667 RepID=UPI0021C4A0C5|nr:GMC oxidoreductase [Rhizobium sp. NRK18]MCQ2003645.1 GMC oxidoreductase [Rhizobium sp. NRK18]
MYDLAIYGSGFAAYAAAQAAVRRGLKVAVIDKGGRDSLKQSLEMSQVSGNWEPIRSGGFDFGAADLKKFSHSPRFVGLGGTSAMWSGKWRPLDAIDFDREISGRKWPISYQDMRQNYQVVEKLFGFSTFTEPQLLESFKELQSCGIRVVPFAQEHEVTRLKQRWIDLQATSKVSLYEGATSIEFLADKGSVRSARIRHDTSNPLEVSAHNHLIAAGCIGSTELISALISKAPCSKNTKYTGYMDHPKGPIGKLIPRKNLDCLDAILSPTHPYIRFALALPEEELLKTGLPNSTIFLWGQSGYGAKLAHWYNRRSVSLIVNVDQFPEADNRLEVEPFTRANWRINGNTRRMLDRFLDLFIPRIEMAFGRVERLAWVPLRASSHPAGTTPLSKFPKEDWELTAEGRVSKFENIFCASSSAFPVCGSANPTMTVAALGNHIVHRLL